MSIQSKLKSLKNRKNKKLLKKKKGGVYSEAQDMDIRKVEVIQNKLHKNSSYRPTDEESKLLTRYGYLDFTKSPDYSCVLWNMDSEDKIQKWNKIINFYTKSDKFRLYGNFGSRIKGIST